MSKSSSPGADATRGARIFDWIDERLDLREALAFARKKTVPQHEHSFWYYWGGISLFFFLVQLVSGVLLLVYYRPGPEAYDSVRRITYDIDFGWLVRSTHSWAANLMVLAVFVHMFSVFFMKAYRKPREFGWWSGLLLLGLTMLFGFSGYLLPMDEMAYFATKVGLEVAGSLPVIGGFTADLIRGGPEVSEVTVQRFFTLHVVILPLLFFGVLGVHLLLVQRHGNALPPTEARKPVGDRRTVPFFPDFFLRDLAVWLIALNVIAVLSSLSPWQLGPQADALAAAPEGIHPEWFFMAQFQLLKVLPEWLGLGVFTIFGVLWVLLPLLDREDSSPQRKRLMTLFSAAALAGLVVFTIWGYAAL